jgi:hypothetical protein
VASSVWVRESRSSTIARYPRNKSRGGRRRYSSHPSPRRSWWSTNWAIKEISARVTSHTGMNSVEPGIFESHKSCALYGGARKGNVEPPSAQLTAVFPVRGEDFSALIRGLDLPELACPHIRIKHVEARIVAKAVSSPRQGHDDHPALWRKWSRSVAPVYSWRKSPRRCSSGTTRSTKSSKAAGK